MSRAPVILFLLQALLAQQPDAALERFAQEGERALAESRYQDAEKAFEKLRQLSPGTAEVHARLGVTYYQEHKFEQAAATLRQALKLKPNLPNADALLAMSLSELGRYAEALPGLEKAFQRSPDPVLKRTAGLQLARTYMGLGRDDQAVATALELKRLYPRDPEVLYHSGKLFGNFAYLTMKRLAEVAPKSVWRWQAAGEAYESQEAYDSAITEYRQVLALDPRRPGIHFRIGRVLLARARRAGSRVSAADEALKEFQQELDLDPTNANAAYEMAEIYRTSGQFNEARTFFEKALKFYPDLDDVLIGLGRTLIALQKPNQAVPPLKKAIAINPESAVAFYSLAHAYRELGDTAEQRKTLSEFRRLRDLQVTQSPMDSRTELTRQAVDSAAPAEP